MKHLKDVLMIAGAVIGLMMPGQMVFADSGDHLRPLSVLTAEWWQWVSSIPAIPVTNPSGAMTNTNPGLDTTGDYCMVGQRGPIWFLVGALYPFPTPPLHLHPLNALAQSLRTRCFFPRHKH